MNINGQRRHPLVVACVHGINTGPEDLYHDAWFQALHDDGPAPEGLEDLFYNSDFQDVRWPSTGTMTRDLFRSFFTADFLEEAVYEVKKQLDMLEPDLVLAHSMGCVVTAGAMHELWWSEGYQGPPTILMAGPHTHPIVGRGLTFKASAPPRPPKKVPYIWNRDDSVCCLRGFPIRRPEWTDLVEIAIPGDLGRVAEHPAEFYLQHPHTLALLRRMV